MQPPSPPPGVLEQIVETASKIDALWGAGAAVLTVGLAAWSSLKRERRLASERLSRVRTELEEAEKEAQELESTNRNLRSQVEALSSRDAETAISQATGALRNPELDSTLTLLREMFEA